MPLIDVRDTRLYYETAGTGDVPLLIIHGAGGGAWVWKDQVERLSPHFTCITYDRRGHSRSEPGADDQSYTTHTEDAAALIEALNLDRPVLVGTSAGGSIALELMHRYPQAARAAVVAEPGLFNLLPGGEQEAKNIIAPVIKQAMETGGPRAAIDAFLSTICPEFWEMIDEGIRERFRENAPVFLQTTSAPAPTLTGDDLTQIEHPVLVVTGSESLQLLHDMARSTAEHLPNAQMLKIEGSGHVAQVEKPDEFAEAVSSFVQQVIEEESARSVSA